ncbi:hypothetical protein ACJMK2_012624 [Sinanodonta woodiana]|uniref:Zinc finger HIT domain-containing protein 3 n=1 Tax=Sinanodonta woodiana TaxID=1069815 RepID=A0ABD3V8T4_SINWO
MLNASFRCDTLRERIIIFVSIVDLKRRSKTKTFFKNRVTGVTKETRKMIKEAKCEICKEMLSKYKCPQCLLRYCSLGCYKDHKAKSCQPIQKTDTQTLRNIPDGIQTQQKGNEGQSLEFDTEDKVSQEALERLGKSSRLLAILENPHLRDIMVGMTTKHPGQLMEAAMHEPIFQEFADECLHIIGEPEAAR